MSEIYTNLDAAESTFFSRQLEHIKSQFFDIKYPELKGRQFLPVDSSAGDGANLITYRQRNHVGQAKIITDYADDLPRADVLGNEFSQKIYDIGSSFGYSVREIRAAARESRNLSAEKAAAARDVTERELDEIAAFGHPSADLKGFVNHPSVTAGSAVTGTWSGATPDQILDDMNEAVQVIRDTTLGIEAPTTILLPEAQYTLIAQRRVVDLPMTILQFFLANNPWITEVMPWYRLSGAGAGAADRMVVYRRNPDTLTLEIPSEFEVFDPQMRNLEFVVPTRLVTAGVIVYKPRAVLYRDGI